VCLPSPFSGGELVVSHGDTCHSFDFASFSGNKDVYQYAAFYGDCVHEIKPVTEGHRVTLTYQILRQRRERDPEDYFVEVDNSATQVRPQQGL
jgi:predicted 2-oxoglutarate/Fe(II)-dependent dioxygenase YbiX